MICLQCGRETNNPKFCSKSCAASYNNPLYPKRVKKIVSPDDLKICNVCFVSKKVSDFYKKCGCCKECFLKKRRDDPKRKDRMKEYREKNSESLHAYGKQHRASLKRLFLKMYGEHCSCCGESEYEFLTLDHIIPRTEENRREKSSLGYKTALQEYRPDLYQVLCYNCNCGRRHGICPHKRDK